MTQEEIMAMEPGVELNAKVAEQVIGRVVAKDDVFGYMERDDGSVWNLLQPYSEDMSVAELVVEKMIKLGYDDAIYWADFGNGIYTEPEAICKAALLAILDEGEIEEA